jgi:hypothetical protein
MDIPSAVKGAAQSKTMLFSMALVFFGAVQTYLPGVLPMIPPKWQGAASMAIGISVAMLRAVTSQSLADKGTPNA